jgi:hypothetical protein
MASVLHWISENRLLLIVVAIFVIPMAVLHLTQHTRPSEVGRGELETLVTRGEPTVLELYSNF